MCDVRYKMRDVQLVDYTHYERRNGIDLVKNRAYNSGGYYFLGFITRSETRMLYFAAFPTLEEAENELDILTQNMETANKMYPDNFED